MHFKEFYKYTLYIYLNQFHINVEWLLYHKKGQFVAFTHYVHFFIINNIYFILLLPEYGDRS